MERFHLHGVVLPDGDTRDVFIADGRFTFTPVAGARTLLDGGYLVPGLIDVHAHLAIASPAGPDAAPEEQVRASARAQLDAGVLAIREPGSPNRASRGLGPQGGLPRTYTAGRFLAPPGGYFAGLAREVDPEQLADAAEEEFRASGAWVKVIGDFVGADGRMQPNFPTAVLAEAARRVHAAGGRIAMHAVIPASIEGAIEARFDTIEHGILLDPDHCAVMAAQGIAWVPTLTAMLPLLEDEYRSFAQWIGLAEKERERIAADAARQPERVREAAEAGVLILAGTDAGMGPQGMIRQEVRHLLDAGLAPEQALAAASWAARRFLGLPCIEEGAPADLVAYPDDPRGDPERLARPSLIILDGRQVR